MPDAGPWTSVPGRFLQNRRIAGRSEPNTVIVANRYSILQDERTEPVHELPKALEKDLGDQSDGGLVRARALIQNAVIGLMLRTGTSSRLLFDRLEFSVNE